MTTRSKCQYRGWTLVEAMVVLLIVSLLALSGSFGLGTWTQKNRVGRAHRHLLSVLRWADVRSLSEKEAVSVCLTKGGVCSADGAGIRVFSTDGKIWLDTELIRPPGWVTWKGFSKAPILTFVPDREHVALNGRFKIGVQGYPDLRIEVILNRLGHARSKS